VRNADLVDVVDQVVRGDNLGWHRMASMLDIAPDRAADFLRAVAKLLADDPAASEQLLHQSALATFARD
jgi:hypothetical protein